jgi:hypothetical protein
MDTFSILGSILLTASTLHPSQAVPEGSRMPRPTPPQLAWQEAELGVLFSYDLHVFDAKHYNQKENCGRRIVDQRQDFAPHDIIFQQTRPAGTRR